LASVDSERGNILSVVKIENEEYYLASHLNQTWIMTTNNQTDLKCNRTLICSFVLFLPLSDWKEKMSGLGSL
jgi:hypothetical protein